MIIVVGEVIPILEQRVQNLGAVVLLHMCLIETNNGGSKVRCQGAYFLLFMGEIEPPNVPAENIHAGIQSGLLGLQSNFCELMSLKTPKFCSWSKDSIPYKAGVLRFVDRW